jgi:hypothetical protein
VSSKPLRVFQESAANVSSKNKNEPPGRGGAEVNSFASPRPGGETKRPATPCRAFCFFLSLFRAWVIR